MERTAGGCRGRRRGRTGRRLSVRLLSPGREPAYAVRCVEALKVHKEFQDAARQKAGDRWKDSELVFCTRTGRELDAHKVSGTLAESSQRRVWTPVWTPRDLRHTYLSLLSHSGMAMENISRLGRPQRDGRHGAGLPAPTPARDGGRCDRNGSAILLGFSRGVVRQVVSHQVQGPVADDQDEAFGWSDLVDLVRHYSNRSDLLVDLEHIARSLRASLEDGAETSASVRSERTPVPSCRINDRLSDAQIDALVSDFQAGDAAWRIAERYGIGRTSVIRILRERKARRCDKRTEVRE
jgi:hypothetical protein